MLLVYLINSIYTEINFTWFLMATLFKSSTSSNRCLQTGIDLVADFAATGRMSPPGPPAD